MDEQLKQETDARAGEFLRELTLLSLRYGVGIAGDPTLFLMEHDDYERQYRSDAESRIDFT